MLVVSRPSRVTYTSGTRSKVRRPRYGRKKISYNSFEKYLEIDSMNYRRKSCTGDVFGGICKKY